MNDGWVGVNAGSSPHYPPPDLVFYVLWIDDFSIFINI